MQNLSDAIQRFHDEVMNLKGQVDGLEKSMANIEEPLGEDWASQILGILEQRVAAIERRLGQINSMFDFMGEKYKEAVDSVNAMDCRLQKIEEGQATCPGEVK